MALTDHDSVEGCARMTVACDAAGIEFIPGTEPRLGTNLFFFQKKVLTIPVQIVTKPPLHPSHRRATSSSRRDWQFASAGRRTSRAPMVMAGHCEMRLDEAI